MLGPLQERKQLFASNVLSSWTAMSARLAMLMRSAEAADP